MDLQHTCQPELDFQIEQADITILKLVLEEVEDHRKHLLRRVSEWFLALKLFGKFHSSRILVPEPGTRELEYFRVAVTRALAQGESLLLDLNKHQEVDTKSIGMEIADIQANVQYLRDLYAARYFEVHPDRAARILETVFTDGTSGSGAATGTASQA